MIERQLPPTEEIINILRDTRQRVNRMYTERYQAENDASNGLWTFDRMLGRLATDYFMNDKLPTHEAIGDLAKAGVMFGLGWLKHRAVRIGVERNLPDAVKEVNEQLDTLLEGTVITPAVFGHYRQTQVFGIKGPGGTRFYDYPEAGQSATYARASADKGIIFLQHPTEPENLWQVEVVNRDGLQMAALDIQLPQPPAGLSGVSKA